MRLLFIFCLVATFAGAQGIQFRNGNPDDAFAAARAARKPVFVEVYSPNCHICQSFYPTLRNGQVGDYYNKTFVNLRLDRDQNSVREWLQRKKILVPQLPFFLYFDAQGTLLHYALSKNSVAEVIRHGQEALNPAKRSQQYGQRFARGERGNDFLINYGMLARITADTTTLVRVMNEYAKRQPAGSLGSATNWSVLQRLILDADNPLARYLIDNYGQFKKYKTRQAVAENILNATLFSSRGATLPPAKIMQIRRDLEKIGVPPSAAANRTLLPEVNALLRQRQSAAAAARMDAQVASTDMGVAELLYIARLFNRRSPDAADVPYVQRWIQKALADQPTDRQQADLQAELATAQRRAGKK